MGNRFLMALYRLSEALLDQIFMQLWGIDFSYGEHSNACTQTGKAMAFFVFDKGITKLAITQTQLPLSAGEAERSKSPFFEILEPSHYNAKV